jgi:hypothetical protein
MTTECVYEMVPEIKNLTCPFPVLRGSTSVEMSNKTVMMRGDSKMAARGRKQKASLL